jgi:hypothetical protein
LVPVGFGAGGRAFPVFALAQAPTGGLFHQAIYTTAAGLEAGTPELEQLSSAGEQPVPNAHSDHGPMEFYDQEHRIPINRQKPPEME